ncbi:MAG: hypothetical protein ACFFHV_07765 [Promethearchaeota archaeon]
MKETNEDSKVEITSELMDFFYKDKNWFELASKSLRFTAPPIIGFFIADKSGTIILTCEIFDGALEHFIKRDIKDENTKTNFDIELIPPFICALENFSEQICIQNLAELKIKGTNIKIHTVFCFSRYTITFFLNPFFKIKPFEDMICEYFNKLFEEYKNEFENIYQSSSRELISQIELKGRGWLRDITYQQLSVKD